GCGITSTDIIARAVDPHAGEVPDRLLIRGVDADQVSFDAITGGRGGIDAYSDIPVSRYDIAGARRRAADHVNGRICANDGYAITLIGNGRQASNISADVVAFDNVASRLISIDGDTVAEIAGDKIAITSRRSAAEVIGRSNDIDSPRAAGSGSILDGERTGRVRSQVIAGDRVVRTANQLDLFRAESVDHEPANRRAPADNDQASAGRPSGQAT